MNGLWPPIGASVSLRSVKEEFGAENRGKQLSSGLF